MSSLVSIFTSLVLGLMFGAGLVKGAAYLFRRTTLSWTQAFQVAAIMFLLSVLSNAVVSRIHIPSLVSALLSVALVGLFGAWFFQSRATDAKGDPLCWKDAFKLLGVFYLLFAASSGATLVVSKIIKAVA